MNLNAAHWILCCLFITIFITSSISLEKPELSLQKMSARLLEMNKPVVNDDRQNKYCRYIMRFLSYFSGERCMVVGSTQEQTRLRTRQDEGDYDYLMISPIFIPVSALEYRADLPCFVYINGLQLVDKLPTIQLIGRRYLPSNLLSNMRPEAFNHIRDFYKLLTSFGSKRGPSSLNVASYYDIKPGKTSIEYKACSVLNARWPLDQIVDHQENERKNHSILSHLQTVAYSNKSDNNKDLQTLNSFVGTSSIRTSKNSQPFHMKQTANNEKYTDKGDFVLKYQSKSSKDFIPAFPISGRPKFLDIWKHRERFWPPSYVVDDIYNSEFYVVAKPALTNRERKKDFSLAYNNAEIKLARSMTIVQKKVILILKAMKKSLLQNYSEILTTFHWKTAVYWNSETLNSSLLTDTEDNVSNLLTKVLDYVINCLRNRDLQHFFIPSNLFAGMSENKSIEIANKISKFRENPIKVLNAFFARQTFDEVKYESLPTENIAEFRKAYNDPMESYKIDIIIAILKKFSSESKEKVKAALHDVFTDALPFFNEEVARGRAKSQMNSALEQLVLSNQMHKERLIDMVVNDLLDKVREEEVNDKNIAQIFLTLILQKVLNQ